MKDKVDPLRDQVVSKALAADDLAVDADFMARRVRTTLGPELASLLIQVSKPTLLAWVRGKEKPLGVSLRRLRQIDQIVTLLLSGGAEDGAVRWLIEEAEYLGYRSPASVFQFDPEAVRQAAMSYAARGPT